MVRITLLFHGALNDFLPRRERATRFAREPHARTSIKHVIESCGVPHTEVGRVLVGGQPVALDDPVREGLALDVYPHPQAEAPTPPTPELRFVLDGHLGKLAVYLRMLGIDAAYTSGADDAALAATAASEARILLTRDRGLLKRRAVQFGFCILHDDPRDQAVAVVRRYRLSGALQPFRRCLRCNALLQPAAKADVLAALQPDTRRFYDEFMLCPACRRVYWKGSHYRRMQGLVAEVLARAGAP